MNLAQKLFDIRAGNVIWVDSAANSVAPRGSFNKPYTTLQVAIDKATSANDDLILVKAGHAETLTAQINADKAGVTIRGLGEGLLRPTLTGNGTIDVIDVSAANVTIENIVFPAPLTDEATADVNVDAAGFTMRDTYHIGSTGSENKVSFVTITANGDNCLIEGMRAYNGVVDMVSGISLAAATRVELNDVRIESSRTIGYSTGTFDDTGAAQDLVVLNSSFMNGKTDVACWTTASNSTGHVAWTYFPGVVAAIAATVVTGSGMAFTQTYCTSNRSKNALLMPVVDA